MKYFKKNKDNTGFTLIELLLYISITGVTLLAVVLFSIQLLGARVKNQVIAEVEQQGIQVLEVFTQAIRNATDINSPIVGQSDTTLSLGMIDTLKNPTILNANNNQFFIKEGFGSAFALNNSRISISDLSFTNGSRTGTPGLIKIEFTLTYNNPEGRQEFDYSRTFRGSASLR